MLVRASGRLAIVKESDAVIEITTYAGYQGDERPRSLVIDGEEHFIRDVIRKERFEDFETRQRRTVFWCEVNDRLVKVIRLSARDWQVAFPSMSTAVNGRKVWKTVTSTRHEEKF